MTGPTKPQGDFCLTPGFTACDKRAEWCGWGAGGASLSSPLCPLRSFLCPFLICTPLTSPAPSFPIVRFCAALCRLGEDRLPKRTPRGVHSQGARVRATQGSTGSFIDSLGTRGQRGAGAGPISGDSGVHILSAGLWALTCQAAETCKSLGLHTPLKVGEALVIVWASKTYHSSLQGCPLSLRRTPVAWGLGKVAHGIMSGWFQGRLGICLSYSTANDRQ